MRFSICEKTVAPCIIKELDFMYALLLSVPIINCVNDQKKKKVPNFPTIHSDFKETSIYQVLS